MTFRVRYFDINVTSQASSPIWNAGLIQGYGIQPDGPYPDNSTLSFNSALNVWTVSAGGGGDATSLQGKAVDATTPTNGQFLIFNDAIDPPNGEWQLQPAVAPTDTQVLAYNSTSGQWEATNQSSGLDYDANGNLIFSNQTVTATGSDNLIFGDLAGPTLQTTSNNVILGAEAAQQSSTTNSVAIGFRAMSQGSGTGSIRIGDKAGYNGINNNDIAIGTSAGEFGQGTNVFNIGAIAIGNEAGRYNQSDLAVAIGPSAGLRNQATFAVAIGVGAGYTGQQLDTVAIGSSAGFEDQQPNAIAIGSGAGLTNQGISAIAIGTDAGRTNLGQNSIAIGRNTASLNGVANSIGLNASGLDLPLTNSGFYVDPVRDDTGSTTTTSVIHYNPTSREVIRRTGIQEDDTSVYLNKNVDLSGVESGAVLGNNAIGWYQFDNPTSNYGFNSATTGTANNLNKSQFGAINDTFPDYRGRLNVVRTRAGGDPSGSNYESLNIGTDLAASGDATLVGWFNIDSIVGLGDQYMLFYFDRRTAIPDPPNNNNGLQNSIHVYLSNNTAFGRVAIRFWDIDNAIDYTLETPLTYADGQWHHIAITLSATTLNLYIDSELITLTPSGTDPGDYRIFSDINRFVIGAYYLPTNNPVTPIRPSQITSIPYLSDYIIFDTVLSPSDIQTLYTGAELCGPVSVKGLLQTTGLQTDHIGTTTLSVSQIIQTTPSVHLVIRRSQSINSGSVTVIDFTPGLIVSQSDASHFTVTPTEVTLNVEGAYHYGYTARWFSGVSSGRRWTQITGTITTETGDTINTNVTGTDTDNGNGYGMSLFTGVIIPAGRTAIMQVFQNTAGAIPVNATFWIRKIY